MTHCFCVLLAACAAGGPAGPDAGPALPPEYVTISPAYEDGTSARTLKDRLRRLINPDSEPRPPKVQPQIIIVSPPVPAIYDAARPLARPAGSPYNSQPILAAPPAPAPADEQSEPFVVEGPVQVLGGPPAKAPAQPDLLTDLKVARKYRDKVGHEEDYSWITGHLFYVRADGGRWVLRYTLPSQADRYGGSVVLAPSVEMRNFREGDLVCVSGQVLDQGRPSHSLGGALYRADTITMVERSDP
jgi:hypothetical protein